MKLYIEKGFGDPESESYYYRLVDEDGNKIDEHISSNDGYAKQDLLRNHPEYKDAKIIFR